MWMASASVPISIPIRTIQRRACRKMQAPKLKSDEPVVSGESNRHLSQNYLTTDMIDGAMEIDLDKIDDTVLGLLWLTLHDEIYNELVAIETIAKTIEFNSTAVHPLPRSPRPQSS